MARGHVPTQTEKRKKMAIQYPYYLPLGEVFDTVRFLSITPRLTGFGQAAEQKMDREGTPIWTVSALVKRGDSAQDTEAFSLTAPVRVAESIGKLPELTPIRLIGLSGGKWVKAGTDRTAWSFAVSAIEVVG